MQASQLVAVVLLVVASPLGVALVVWLGVRGRRDLGTSADRATFATLHTAALASPLLRAGLTGPGVPRAAKHLRALLGTAAVALSVGEVPVAWDGAWEHHRADVAEHASQVLAGGRAQVRRLDPCPEARCPLRHAIVAPLVVEDRVVGTLVAYDSHASAGLVRATEEVAAWVSSQLDLAELDASRSRLMEAEVRALRAQISPHFIYNSLTAIASFVRTDPERARELLVEFADFTRYSFRRHGEFTTLAEELRSIEHYLVLERARFGDRLQVTLRIAPEVLAVTVPFLCVQPLVENSVRHGLEGRAGPGHVTVVAADAGSEAVITVEDDGAGADPDVVLRALVGQADGDSVGLGNVDARLRQAYGGDVGLLVETAPGAGTKVTLRVPKYRAGVHAR